MQYRMSDMPKAQRRSGAELRSSARPAMCHCLRLLDRRSIHYDASVTIWGQRAPAKAYLRRSSSGSTDVANVSCGCRVLNRSPILDTTYAPCSTLLLGTVGMDDLKAQVLRRQRSVPDAL